MRLKQSHLNSFVWLLSWKIQSRKLLSDINFSCWDLQFLGFGTNPKLAISTLKDFPPQLSLNSFREYQEYQRWLLSYRFIGYMIHSIVLFYINFGPGTHFLGHFEGRKSQFLPFMVCFLWNIPFISSSVIFSYLWRLGFLVLIFLNLGIANEPVMCI